METTERTEQERELERLGKLFDVVEAVRTGSGAVLNMGKLLGVELDTASVVLTYAAEMCTRAGLGAQGIYDLHVDGILEQLTAELD